MPDTAIAAQVQPPSLQSLSSILGIQQQRQALQAGAMELQRAKIETDAQQGANNFFQNWDPGQHHGEDGTLDLDSAHASPQYQALSGAARLKVEAQLNSIRAAQLSNKSALATLNGTLVGQFGNVSQAAAKIVDPAARQQMLEDWSKQSPENARIYGIYSDRLKASGYNSGALNAIGDQAMDVTSQKPKPIAVGTGAATVFGTQLPSTGATSITGPTVRNAPPPGFSVVVDPRTNNPYLVNQQTGEVRDMGYGYPGSRPATVPSTAPVAPGAPRAPATVPSSIPPPMKPGQGAAQTALNVGGAEDINKHYANAQAEAQRAETFTGIARNVQDFARQAITGTPEQRLNLINGILAYAGVPGASDLKTASDLLEKNMAQLNLQGNTATDLKTVVTQMAQPHMSMSQEAIERAAGQLIGQVQMKKAIGMAMTGEYNHAIATGNGDLYRAKRDAISKLSDARVWEFNSMSPDEQKKFRQNLKPQDDKELGAKYKAANALGLLGQ